MDPESSSVNITFGEIFPPRKSGPFDNGGSAWDKLTAKNKAAPTRLFTDIELQKNTLFMIPSPFYLSGRFMV